MRGGSRVWTIHVLDFEDGPCTQHYIVADGMEEVLMWIAEQKIQIDAVIGLERGAHYVANQDRLRNDLNSQGQMHYTWQELPPGSPTHADVPYGFKYSAIDEVARKGATSILWLDSSAVILKPLDPIWSMIEQQGYWFSRNYDYNNGQFCSDEALKIMGMTREEAFKVPHVTAACFGLRMDHPYAIAFMSGWKTLAEAGAFKGDRGNCSGKVEDPTQYQGHRNDQSCASQMCYLLGMNLTDPPDYWAEQNDKTILTLGR